MNKKSRSQEGGPCVQAQGRRFVASARAHIGVAGILAFAFVALHHVVVQGVVFLLILIVIGCSSRTKLGCGTVRPCRPAIFVEVAVPVPAALGHMHARREQHEQREQHAPWAHGLARRLMASSFRGGRRSKISSGLASAPQKSGRVYVYNSYGWSACSPKTLVVFRQFLRSPTLTPRSGTPLLALLREREKTSPASPDVKQHIQRPQRPKRAASSPHRVAAALTAREPPSQPGVSIRNEEGLASVDLAAW